jgi:hypothetical protein
VRRRFRQHQATASVTQVYEAVPELQGMEIGLANVFSECLGAAACALRSRRSDGCFRSLVDRRAR